MKVRIKLFLLTALAALCMPMSAQADVAAERLQAIMAATSGFSVCLGFGNVVTADVHSSPGDEVLMLRANVILRADSNSDGNRVLQHQVSVIAKSSSTNQVLWESRPVFVNSFDAFTDAGGVGFNFPFDFTSGLYFRFLPLFPFGGECLNMTVATANNTPYVIVGAGTSVATGGSPDTAVDRTRIRLRVLSGQTGATVITHSINGQGGSFVSPGLPTISDIDDDGDQELLVWRANIRSQTRITLFMTYFNLLTGAQEGFVSVPVNSTLTIE